MLPNAILLTVGFLALGGTDSTREDLKKAQGDWKIVAVEIDSKDTTDAFKDGKVTVKDEKVTVVMPKGQQLVWTFKADAGTKPRCVDFKNDKGETSEGIYELKGDDLKVCVSIKGGVAERPGEFATRENSGRILWTLRRDKP